MNVLTFIEENNGILALLVTLLVAISGLVHYVSVRRAEERGKQYDRYHKLLQDLNVGFDGTAQYIDRQVAVIYELRNFPEYWPVSIRILQRSMPRWKELRRSSSLAVPALGGSPNNLFDEAALTIAYIKRRQLEKSYLCIAEEDRD